MFETPPKIKKEKLPSKSLEQRVDDLIQKIGETVTKESRMFYKFFPLTAIIIANLDKPIKALDYEQLLKNKPLKDKEILELGFGGPPDPHALYLPKLGAQMFGIEPSDDAVRRTKAWVDEDDEENRDANGKILLEIKNLKKGSATEIAKLFPKQKFDFIIGSRVLEELPMAGSGTFETGIEKTKQILMAVYEALKDKGVTIHTTTMPFMIEDPKLLQKLGFKILTLNSSFKNTLNEARYYTVLKKSE